MSTPAEVIRTTLAKTFAWIYVASKDTDARQLTFKHAEW